MLGFNRAVQRLLRALGLFALTGSAACVATQRDQDALATRLA
jgi:hypothetical protein